MPFVRRGVEGHTRRLAWCGVAAALALLGLLALARPTAAANPDCSNPSPGVTVCINNQSGGIDNAGVFAGTTTLNVNNLNADIGPPKGISLTNNLGHAPSGSPASDSSGVTINFEDSHKITTTNNIGVLGQSKGEDGADGCHFCAPPAGTGTFTARSGGNGGPVTILTQGPIVANGGAGVVGQSFGGAGGTGASGQDGGNGGAGGTVSITVQNSISTTGAGAPGIAALSRGANGGNGDNTLVTSHGGQGLQGGDVTVKTSAAGSVETANDNSIGILAQSIGGGGGHAKSGFAFGDAQSGGAAAFGGKVEVDTLASITTHGNVSIGILAQSIGGGGGGGSFATTGFTTAGGDGGSGGSGGDVVITTGAGTQITTGGFQSSAIFAQSIGGGGGAGSGGFGLLVSSAGGGSPGGKGGNVSVTNDGKIVVTGDQSTAIYAQSIGGGGGSGGASGGLVSFGGGGGTGQNAGAVTVHNHGEITVSGNGHFDNNANSTLSVGIFAQAVGGGGGDGGISGGLVSFGGTGGASGTGGDVTVENTAKITANCAPNCFGGTAIFAQSVGGGGGNGGASGALASFGGSGGGGGDGKSVTVNNSGAGLSTTSDSAMGIFAQSVGGGGGNGAFAGGIVSFGGSGAGGGKGGNVVVNNSSLITTQGKDSAGIFAQSVGGGGGNGGGAVGVGLFGSFAMGGSGGTGSDAGTVCVNSADPACVGGQNTTGTSIKTAGDRSTGILAQAIGGGGGNGGFAVSASAGLFANVAIGAGGAGARGGMGGNVFVGGTGDITTGSNNINAETNSRFGQFSSGIDAESIGGGGGNGGFAVSGSASTGVALGGSIGGSGGGGSDGGSVTVNSHYKIETFGDQATGLFARSIGGGGGDGGFAINVTGSPYLSASLAFGGGGAAGGDGGVVRADNVGDITTHGALSNGITAQSIGGGGGNGGFSVAGTLTIGGGASLGASFSFGGDGGVGGAGKDVHVGSTGDIHTSGPGSIGILAQSIGGGGGNGGFSGAIAVGAGSAYSNAMGGTGGSCDANTHQCNSGGHVEVISIGSITTEKDNSSGISAQSIGGGGGNGGFSISAAATMSNFSVGAAKSGDGGTGGTGGKVDVTSTGVISTGGNLSYGILAQSIGGGGGNGGFAISAALSQSGAASGNSIGGRGGNGNGAGEVNVTTNKGTTTGDDVIRTSGIGAIGILAQSVGGGGGNGGFAINANGSLDSDAGSKNSLGGNGALGGDGGDASNGGKVTVKNNGAVRTTNLDAHGIVAQSIGGGGGSGGFSIAASFSNDGAAVANALGGKGGNGGSADSVQVINNGDIYVGASFVNGNPVGDVKVASGIIAQSIGGGGGTGGFSIAAGLSLNDQSTVNSIGGSGGAGGHGGAVEVSNANIISVAGAHSSGIIAQSIGGGGGTGGFSIAASATIGDSKDAKNTIGGSGGKGGDGGAAGTVKVTTTAGSFITTYGDTDTGITAQSIGGGGGTGGFSLVAGFSMKGDTKSSVGGSCGEDCQKPEDPDPTKNAGGGGGTSNTVTVDYAGHIVTKGANSTGILAQSIGGGGGSGGFSIGAAFSVDGGAATNSVGGSGGNGGDGAVVDVTQRALSTIDVMGKNSSGIVAQSIGGGGGTGGFAIAADANINQNDVASNVLGGSGGKGGEGKAVTVTTEAGSKITTHDIMSQGIIAQSIGGGGGSGGFAIGASFSTKGNVQSSVGGSCDADCSDSQKSTGGGGGKGGKVTVDSAGTIETMAASSIGIVAQSIGGGGGTGGFAAVAGFTLNGAGATNSVGGQGGDGGTSDEVKVTNQSTGHITTNGAKSIGILAQSIGGGGGDGGLAVGVNVNNGGGGSSDSSIHGATNGVGGAGGKGGDGGLVTVINNGSIVTNGAMSTGIVAQSIGGGGGTGGITVNGTVEMGNGGMTNSAGGDCNQSCADAKAQNQAGGGGGGDGKKVVVTNNGSIDIKGNNSIGIIAQSIGGGGGSAGFAGNASFNGGALKNNVGGVGGAGGNGGDVVVTNVGSIRTFGANSTAILAQSIGGGGGNAALSLDVTTGGGAASADMRVGGLDTGGGPGGTAGTVTVNTTGGIIETNGAMSYGVLAQAINGGGGNSVLAALGLKIGGDPTITVGGDGSTQSNAQNISVTTGNVTNMMGAASIGQAVQSIGGGGGTGGFAVTDFGAGNIPLNLFIGGDHTGGANSGNGGTVTYKNSNSITTAGDNSAGVLVQSIGGGGGYGQYTFQTVTGVGGNTVTLNVGGSQTSAATGNTVDIPIFSGPVNTTGVFSSGLIAQSIGGGGGLAGFVATSGIGLAGNGLHMAAGSGGGAGGDGGVVGATSTAAITTTGVGALGIIAQSIGGGGGVTQAFGVAGTGAMTLGSAGGAAGNGLGVTLSSSEQVWTQGTGAHAILAQSIGGGGGLIQAFAADGTPTSLPVVAGAGGSGGNGGAVSVTATGQVVTYGNGANGIIAQSVGGGGGLVGSGAFANTLGTGPFAGSVGGAGTAGAVTVDAQSHVVTTGLGSTAIYAQSISASGLGGNIGITLGNATKGTGQFVLGGADGATTTNAVTFSGGAANTLLNYAYLSTSSGIDGMTVRGGAGNEAISSFGHMIGSIDLGTGVNSLHGQAYNTNPSVSAGVFDSGATINLGGTAAANLYTNDGVLSPGAFLRVLTTNENGNYLQTAAGGCGSFGQATSTCGYYGVDLDLLSLFADRVNVTGTASVSGAVVVNINNPGDATPGTTSVTILSAAGGATHPNLALQAYQTAVATYSLVYPNPNDINLQYKIDFSPDGLTQNQHAVGDAINAIQTAHVPAFKPIAAALFYQPTVEQLGAIYNSLSGEGVAALQTAAINSNDMFHSSIVSQARFWVFDNDRNDVNSMVFYDAPLGYAAARANTFPANVRSANAYVPDRTWRLWTTFNGGNWKFAGNGIVGSAPTTVSGGGFASGIDYQFSPWLMAGVAIGYGKASIAVPERATGGNSEGTHIAAYAAARGDNAYALGSLGLDYFSNNENRVAYIPGTILPPLFGMQIPAIPGFDERPTGSFNSYSVSGRFETGYKYNFGWYNITPLAGFNFTALHVNGFTETNAGRPSAVGLSYAGKDVYSLPAFLGAQFDGRQQLANGGSLYGWLRTEWVHEFLPHRTVDPSFIAAPGFGFVVEGAAAPTDLARISMGGKVALNDSVSVTADVRADIYHTPSYSGFAGVRVAW